MSGRYNPEVSYSTNRWSKRYRAEEVVQKHLNFVTKASNAARRSIPCQLDIPYGTTAEEKYDIFGTNLPNESPIFIYVHGGDFGSEITREISSFMVPPLVKNNFKVIIIGYGSCPQATVVQLMEQIQNAFVKCVEYANNCKSKSLYIGGHQCGATLVASIFRTHFITLPEPDQKLLKGVFLISGLYDLQPLTDTHHNEILKLDRNTAFRISPLCHTIQSNTDASYYVIKGENESPCYARQSRAFCRRLREQGYKAIPVPVYEVDHYDIVENMVDENYEVIKLITNMEPPKDLGLLRPF